MRRLGVPWGRPSEPSTNRTPPPPRELDELRARRELRPLGNVERVDLAVDLGRRAARHAIELDPRD